VRLKEEMPAKTQIDMKGEFSSTSEEKKESKMETN
jgi:hypothetical protein